MKIVALNCVEHIKVELTRYDLLAKNYIISVFRLFQ